MQDAAHRQEDTPVPCVAVPWLWSKAKNWHGLAQSSLCGGVERTTVGTEAAFWAAAPPDRDQSRSKQETTEQRKPSNVNYTSASFRFKSTSWRCCAGRVAPGEAAKSSCGHAKNMQHRPRPWESVVHVASCEHRPLYVQTSYQATAIKQVE